MVTSFQQLQGMGWGQVAGKIVLFNVAFDENKALAGYALEAYGDAVAYRGEGRQSGCRPRSRGIVVSAHHLDSWDLGTGAIDDAAGVAAAMESAHLIHQHDLHPKRTIRVIAWMDEENGGRGHDAYVGAHQAELANHVGAIESDFGAGHPLGFMAKINPAAAAFLQPILGVMRPIGATVLKPTNSSPGSDIAPLVKSGVPGFAPLVDARTYFNYHHTAADTVDKVVPRNLQENAAAMAVLGYTLANLGETLPR